MNTLYYGDNLNILRRYIKDESVDLIYLDPPFNSNRNYNVLFKDESGAEADSQIMAFEDTWHWAGAARTYNELILEGDKVAEMLQAFYGFIGTNQMMAYLVMMAVRLKELHRVLKPTGSLYLHCDPTASHYLKILLDTIFSAENFRSEVIWKRSGSHGSAKRWGPLHDTIFFYTKSQDYTWNRIFENYDEEYVNKFYRSSDEKGRYQLVSLTGAGVRTGDSGKEWRGVNPTAVGRHWAVPSVALQEVAEIDKIDASNFTTQEKLDLLYKHGIIAFPPKGNVPRQKRYLKEDDGVSIQDIVTDILPISSQAQERLGYPTQKPVALLERIIQASSNEGDLVLDPFAGCGTTIAAAQKLNRQWIGIDVTQLSIALLKNRLEGNFGLLPEGVKKSSPPYEGGVAPATPLLPEEGWTRFADGVVGADGVVLSEASDAQHQLNPDSVSENHPPAEAAVPLLRKEGSLSYRVIGEPEDLHDAKQLATENRYQFQYWALSLIQARPLGGQTDGRTGKKGSDKGIDGIKVFTDDNSGKAKRVIVQVKSGGVKSADIRDLVGTIDRESAAIGVFITLEDSTSHMRNEAATAGFFHSDGWHKDYPRIQILTVEELLSGKQVDMPPSGIGFKQAEKVMTDSKDQHFLDFG